MQNTLLISDELPSVCDLLRKMVFALAWSDGLDSRASSVKVKTMFMCRRI